MCIENCGTAFQQRAGMLALRRAGQSVSTQALRVLILKSSNPRCQALIVKLEWKSLKSRHSMAPICGGIVAFCAATPQCRQTLEQRWPSPPRRAWRDLVGAVGRPKIPLSSTYPVLKFPNSGTGAANCCIQRGLRHSRLRQRRGEWESQISAEIEASCVNGQQTMTCFCACTTRGTGNPSARPRHLFTSQ
jgi:hypothetical protein